MGQRANLIVVEGRKYQLFYSHWCANTLPRDLFWGPPHALAFVRAQRLVDESGWLDDVWAEGGVVLDLERKHLLLYGGEDVLHDVPLRRVYLELLALAWEGWTVRWAYEGIVDLADYVCYPRDRVLTRGDMEATACELTPPLQRDWIDLVASILLEDGMVRLFPLAGNVPSYLAAELNPAKLVQTADGFDRLFLDEWTTEFPTGGFHLDVAARALDFWMASDAPDLLNRVAKTWAGWEVRWHTDNYEAQLERTGGRLRFPIPDRQTLLERCRQMLLVEATTSPVDTVRKLDEQERDQGKEADVNPWALRDDRIELSMDERLAILSTVTSQL